MEQLKLKMRLQDWESIERKAEQQMRDSFSNMTIARILYREAIINIKKLGGKTNAEKDREHRQQFATATSPV